MNNCRFLEPGEIAMVAPNHEFFVGQRITIEDGSEWVVRGVIVDATPRTKLPDPAEIREAMKKLEAEQAARVMKLLDDNIPQFGGEAQKAVAMAAGMSRYDGKEEATPAVPATRSVNAAFPRMIMEANRPCYVCGRKPDRLPVALLEYSKENRIPCCGHCAQFVLGYEIQEDGHLTRKPSED